MQKPIMPKCNNNSADGSSLYPEGLEEALRRARELENDKGESLEPMSEENKDEGPS